MKEIISYIVDYTKGLNKRIFIACSLLTALMIFLNYYYGIDYNIENTYMPVTFFSRYLVFLIAFGLPYFFYVFQGKNYFKNRLILLLILLSPAIFSWKMVMNTQFHLADNYLWDYYWNQVIYWPMRLIVIACMLFILWKLFYNEQSFFGLTVKNFEWRPYLLMLLVMIPLVAAASTQPDFLRMYPKLREVETVLYTVKNKWLYHLLYELSYGSDFITVELFFRGFLILAFIKIAGKDAILPMACFYCTIHFGKPLGECISSYFGGLILGIVVYNTRSIVGGLIVHLGIAWLMEAGGYTGNMFK